MKEQLEEWPWPPDVLFSSERAAHRLELRIAHLFNPLAGPLDRFKAEVHRGVTQKDDSLNATLSKPAQAGLALVLHQRQGDRLLYTDSLPRSI